MDKLQQSRKDLFEKLAQLKQQPTPEVPKKPLPVLLAAAVVAGGLLAAFIFTGNTSQQGTFNTVIDGKGHQVEVVNVGE